MWLLIILLAVLTNVPTVLATATPTVNPTLHKNCVTWNLGTRIHYDDAECDGLISTTSITTLSACEYECRVRDDCVAGVFQDFGATKQCTLYKGVCRVDFTGNFADQAFTCTEVTAKPTAEPTDEPTLNPTLKPTLVPTLEPTLVPTLEPTVEPTNEATLEPTIETTEQPTVEATVEPTNPPTLRPTNPPTNSSSVPVRQDNEGLSTGAIAGIAVGSAVLLSMVVYFTRGSIATFLLSI